MVHTIRFKSVYIEKYKYIRQNQNNNLTNLKLLNYNFISNFLQNLNPLYYPYHISNVTIFSFLLMI